MGIWHSFFYKYYRYYYNNKYSDIINSVKTNETLSDNSVTNMNNKILIKNLNTTIINESINNKNIINDYKTINYKNTDNIKNSENKNNETLSDNSISIMNN